jgi:DnaJ-class molecular chaperone
MEALYLQRVNLALDLPPFKFEQARRWSGKGVKDPYDKLGISPNSTDQEVKKAYRKFVLLYHPDRSVGNKKSNRIQFEEIQLAYETICRERQIK